MKKAAFLIVTMAILFGILFGACTKVENPPNVLLIMTDDLGFSDTTINSLYYL